MSTVDKATDTILVNRAGTDHRTTVETMSALQDTDLLLINRGGVDYRCDAKDVKAALNGGGMYQTFLAQQIGRRAGTWNYDCNSDCDGSAPPQFILRGDPTNPSSFTYVWIGGVIPSGPVTDRPFVVSDYADSYNTAVVVGPNNAYLYQLSQSKISGSAVRVVPIANLIAGNIPADISYIDTTYKYPSEIATGQYNGVSSAWYDSVSGLVISCRVTETQLIMTSVAEVPGAQTITKSKPLGATIGKNGTVLADPANGFFYCFDLSRTVKYDYRNDVLTVDTSPSVGQKQVLTSDCVVDTDSFKAFNPRTNTLLGDTTVNGTRGLTRLQTWIEGNCYGLQSFSTNGFTATAINLASNYPTDQGMAPRLRDNKAKTWFLSTYSNGGSSYYNQYVYLP
jgi:hypothetical protein